jgi:hypothetical protein
MFEDNRIKNDIEICCPPCEEDCRVTAFQEMDVCVPITIEPFVKLGEAQVECIEEPCLIPTPCHTWNKNGTCRFTLSQKICVMVPIEFKANTSSGNISVICGDTSDEDCPSHECDDDCGCEDQPQPPYNCHDKDKHHKKQIRI